jgi:hypothetical protein
MIGFRDLYSGYNGVNQVYSYLLTSNGEITSFSGDIFQFITVSPRCYLPIMCQDVILPLFST